MRKKDLLFIAAGMLITLSVFGSSIFFTGEHADDIIYLGRSHLLEFSWNNLKFWWQPVLELWGPLTGYSFMIDQALWGAENINMGAHAGNLLLHLLAVWGFYVFLRQLKFPPFCAFLAMLFWAIHPQRAESVVWMAERKDVLLLTLTMWCLCCFIKAEKQHNKLLYVCSVLLFLLTFAVKPAVIGLPAILTAGLWGRYRSRKVSFYLKHTGIFWLISLVYFLYIKLNAPMPAIADSEGVINTLVTVSWRYGMYLQKTFFPFDLNPRYPHFSFTESSLLPLFSAGLVWIVLLAFLRRRNIKACYLHLPLLVCFSAAVAPALLKIGDVDFADRYSYFPSIFLITAAASLLCTFARSSCLRKKVICTLSVLLVTFYGILGAKEVFVWQSPESRSAAELDTARPNYRSLIAEAVTKYEQGDIGGACLIIDRLNRDYSDTPPVRRKSIELFTKSFEALILFKSSRRTEALRKAEEVFADPRWSLLINTTYGYPRTVMLITAQAYQKNKMPRRAAVMYRMIADFYALYEPLEKEFYSALAELCLDNKKAALHHFEKALKYNPEDENIRKNIEILKKLTR